MTIAKLGNTIFAIAMATAAPGPLGGGCCIVRHCVDYPAFGGSILRNNARLELLPRNTHRSRISGMERSHLYHGGGNSGGVVLLRAS